MRLDGLAELEELLWGKRCRDLRGMLALHDVGHSCDNHTLTTQLRKRSWSSTYIGSLSYKKLESETLATLPASLAFPATFLTALAVFCSACDRSDALTGDVSFSDFTGVLAIEPAMNASVALDVPADELDCISLASFRYLNARRMCFALSPTFAPMAI